MADAALSVNAGSSSIKFALFEIGTGEQLTATSRGQIEGIGTAPHFIARDPAGAVQQDRRFTALDGLMMGTRCGTLDPGVVLHLIEQRGMTAKAVEELLYQRSGLLGVSGVSNDCARCWRAVIRMPPRRSSCSYSAWHARRAGWLARSGGWMGLCSLPASASMPERCARPRASGWRGWGCESMRRRMPAVMR